MATTEQLVKAQAAYRGEDPDAAWSAFSGGTQGAAPVPSPMPAPMPAPVAPDPVTSSAPITADDINARFNAAAEPYGVGARLPVEQAQAPSATPAPAPSADPFQVPVQVADQAMARAQAQYGGATKMARTADPTSVEVEPGVVMTRPENQVMGGRRVSDGQPVAPMAAAPAPAEDAPVAIAPPTPIGPNATGRDIVRAGMTDADAATERAQRVAADSIERRDAALDQLSGLNAERRKQLDEQFAGDEKENAAFRERNKATMEKVDAMMDEASKTEIKDRRTRGQKIGAIIASALAGIGDAITSMAGNKTNFQENVGKSIQGLVDRDMEMQREALKDKRNSAAQKLTELGIAQKTFKDERDATEAARIARTEQYLNSAKEVAMKIGNEDQRKQALMDIEELGYRNAKAKEELGLRLAQEDRLGRKGGGGGGSGKVGRMTLTQLEAKEQDGTITADEKMALLSIRDRERKLAGDGSVSRQQLEQRAAAGDSEAQAQLAELRKREADALVAERNASGTKTSTEQQHKMNILRGVQPSVQNVEKYLNAESTPYWGVRSGTQWIPDALTPEENINFRNDVMSIANIALRDESGAAIGKEEQAEKLNTWGVFSGDANIRRRGLEKLMYEYRSRMGEWNSESSQQTSQPAPTRGASGSWDAEQPQTVARVRVRAKNGRVYDMDPNAAAAAIKAGDAEAVQ